MQKLAGLLALVCISMSTGLQLGAVRLGTGTAHGSHGYPLRMTAFDSYDTNEVVVAARKGKVDVLYALLDADRAAANFPVKCEKIPTMDGATSIIWAARQGRLEAVQLLLSNKAEVNAASQSGWTALYAAALNGHEAIVELLVNNGACVQAAMEIGDERTNLNLQRMLEVADLSSATPPALQQQPMKSTVAFPPRAPPAEAAQPPSPSPPALLRQPDATALKIAAADAPADWKVAARAETIPAPLASEGALAGMGELEAMKVRLEWRAPPSPEEQAGADRARQTVFKYRHDRIKELEAAMAYGQPRAPAAAAPAAPAATAFVPAAASSAVAPAAVTVTRGATVVDASLLARIVELEAKVNAMSGGFEAGYAKGFAEGFVAGRKETIR